MPHYQVYWLPFDQQGDGTLDSAYLKYNEKVTAGTARIVWGYYQNCLADVKEWETLIINGHSTDGSMYISSHENDQGQRLSVTELASRIIQCGLPRNHVKIRILACQSTTFAQYLASTLGRGLDLEWYQQTRGGSRANNNNSYHRIVVAGYRGKIFYNSGTRTLVWPLPPSQGFPQPNTTNSGQVAWYNSNGAAAKPAVSTIAELQAQQQAELVT